MVRPEKTRRDKPSGREIAQKAKAMRLDRKKSVSGKKNGKVVAFTGADLSKLVPKGKHDEATDIAALNSMAEGQVIGLLENELEGDETNLPAGTFDLLIANVNDEWKCYAERDGEIVAEAVKASVERQEPVKGADPDPLPEFSPEGWCIRYPFWTCCDGWHWRTLTCF